ncbi:hypothetical protein BASA81_005810 [Batrachochytrium salamandrivorans]|nr:hypothetical protein BASA81_005810 [Batrachochytrium salamandrivorans]
MSKPPPPKPASSSKPPPPKPSPKSPPSDSLVKPSEVALGEVDKPPSTPPKAPEQVQQPMAKPPAPVFRQPTANVLANDTPAVKSFLPPPKPASTTPPKPASTIPPKPLVTPAVFAPPLSTPSPPKPPAPAPKPVVVPAAFTAKSTAPPPPVAKPATTPPPKPVVAVIPNQQAPELTPIIRTTPQLSRQNSDLKVQFAAGSPQRVTIPRKQPTMSGLSPLSLDQPARAGLGPYSTSHSASFVSSAFAFYLLPLLFVLVTSPFPGFDSDLAPNSVLVDRALTFALGSEPTLVTEWQPNGMRHTVPSSPLAMSPKATRRLQDSFIVGLAVGPRFDLAYHTEPYSLVLGSSSRPVFDDQGNVFFCPFHSKSSTASTGEGQEGEEEAEISLVVLDLQTGKRKWNYSEPVEQSMFFGRANEPIVRAGSGTPLLLLSGEEEEGGGGTVVYHSTRLKTYALRAGDGKVVWTAPNGQVPPKPKQFDANRMVGGLVHLPLTDSLVGLTGDGYVFALDRATGLGHCESKQLVCELAVEEEMVTGEEEVVEEELLRGSHFASVRITHPPACGKLSPLAQVFLPSSDLDGETQGRTRLLVLEDSTLFAIDVLVKLDYYDEMPYRLEKLDKQFDLSAAPSTPIVVVASNLVLVGDVLGGITGIDPETLASKFKIALPPALGETPVQSLVFAQDEHVVYATTRNGACKFDLDTQALVWERVHVSPSEGGVAVVTCPAPIVLAANGLLLAVEAVGAASLEEGSSLLLGVSGILLLDRHSGEQRSLHLAPKVESISALSVGIDGSVFAVMDPTKRLPDTVGEEGEGGWWKGGLVRFKSRNFLELARDAACASGKRMENALQYEPGWFQGSTSQAEAAGREDAKQTQMLAWQANNSREERSWGLAPCTSSSPPCSKPVKS